MKKTVYLFVSITYAVAAMLLISLLFVPNIFFTLFRFFHKRTPGEAVTSISDYIRDVVFSVDQTANVSFSVLLNATLIKKQSFNKFGDPDETISSVLGRNEYTGLLTKTGKAVVWLLDKVDKNHCANAIGY